MRVNYVIEQGAPKRRKIDKEEEKKFTEYFWEMIGAVRSKRYRVKHFDSLNEQVEEERKLNDAANLID